MSEKPTFWFAAKRYGLGWGLPVRWEGWAVFASYAALIYAGIYYVFDPYFNRGALMTYIIVLTAILIAIMVAKGERPLAWRWGGK